jgi:hypothetical protein
VSVTVVANEVPTVALALPRNGQRLVPGAIDLLATASDGDGSIARVDFYAGTTLVGSATARPYAATWTNASVGTFTLTASAVDNAGAVVRSDAATITVAPITLSIDSPTESASIPQDFALVRGTFNAPENAGVTVNGIVAASDGTNFFVNRVPLSDGTNTIEVVVTTETGATTSTSIAVTRTAAGVFRIEASADELIGPGSVTLNALWSTEVRPAMLMIENFGSAVVDNTIFDGNRLVQLTFREPGLYTPEVTVTDTDGKTYSQQIAIMVLDRTNVDTMLRSIWDGVSGRLRAQDIDGALKIASPGARSRYRAPLHAIANALPAALASWEPPSGGDISPRVAEYSIRRIANGVKKRYFRYLIKDGDGVWRLESM